MYNKINRFVINKLWGDKTIDLKLKDNKLIIVGENGSGKTTILRIIYEVLDCKWSLLANEEFESIQIYIDDNEPIIIEKKFIISAKELLLDFNDPIINEMPITIKRKIRELHSIEGINISYSKVLELFDRYGYQNTDEYIKIQNKININENEVIKRYTDNIKSALNFSILYMPTYRRIEKLSRNNRFLLRRYNLLDNKNSFEFVGMGMKDVEYEINKCLEEIKIKADRSANRLNYQCFKGILNKASYKIEYNKEILQIDAIEKVFGSLNEDVLSKEESEQIKGNLINMRKENILERQSYEQIVYYFYNMLYERYQEIKKDEKKILNFFDSCNKYLNNKKFIYNEKEYSYSIVMIDNEGGKREIKLESLSSGEKQVVSMFSCLYLSPINNILILIDEPELSLSVPWQKRYLLDIVNGEACVGIVAVTHSPFVFDNSLKCFARGLKEFIL
ncbi:AAA family ATPase [Clostridium perfringens]|uniref:AAA family ATPase n=1 Tax=Clostridium perfringens TaxID=1502 RepID=UPI000D718F43|nr:AAA family ATPase [Clostridium perfringens]MBI6006514.1 AAA family ATPase [Clostridium perfringens]MBO3422128.1 AAA family ATPase [Clostridium perfringens]MCX0365118.1 AAA family ATPase [Clostridium perfringens]MDC4245076.1 AAA family ATPase [Clostridium perfringens]MDK0528865.1 AAA family ATPase [Clostridium perfringens]